MSAPRTFCWSCLAGRPNDANACPLCGKPAAFGETMNLIDEVEAALTETVAKARHAAARARRDGLEAVALCLETNANVLSRRLHDHVRGLRCIVATEVNEHLKKGAA